MADTSNLSNFLEDIADAIRTKKETTDKIPAENFDSEILSIETGGSGDVKLFETVEEMQADETAKEGDLAVVYRSEVQNTTVDSQFQIVTFPKTVVLPEAYTGDSYCMLRAVNEESSYFSGRIMLSQTSCEFLGYGESSSFGITYSSEDGITYTRTDSEDETVDLGTEVQVYNSEEWDDNLGYFIQVGSQYFGGLYNYCVDVDDTSTLAFPLLSSITANNEVLTFGGQFKEFTKIDALKQLILKIKEDENYTDSCTPCLYYKNDVLYAIGYTVNSGSDFAALNLKWDIDTERYYFSQSSNSADAILYTLDIDNQTYSKSTIEKYTTEMSAPLYISYDISSDTIPIHFGYSYGDWKVNLYGITVVSTINSKTYFDNPTVNLVLTPYKRMNTYCVAPTQLTLNEANELLPGKIGYGKNGVVTGDSSIYDNLDMKTVVSNISNGVNFKTIDCTSKENIKPSKLYNIDSCDVLDFNHIIVKEVIATGLTISKEVLTKLGIDLSLYTKEPMYSPIARDGIYYYFMVVLYDNVDNTGYKHFVFKATSADYSDAVQVGETFSCHKIFISADLMTPVINNHIILLELDTYNVPGWVNIDVLNNTVSYQEIGTAMIRNGYDYAFIGNRYILFTYCSYSTYTYIYDFQNNTLSQNTDLIPSTIKKIKYSNSVKKDGAYYTIVMYTDNSHNWTELLACDSDGTLTSLSVSDTSSTTIETYLLAVVDSGLYMFENDLNKAYTPNIKQINITTPSESIDVTGFTFDSSSSITSGTISKNTMIQHSVGNTVIMYDSCLCSVDFENKIITYESGVSAQIAYGYDTLSDGVYGGMIRSTLNSSVGYSTIYLNRKLSLYDGITSQGLALSLNSSSDGISLALLSWSEDTPISQTEYDTALNTAKLIEGSVD